jgi:hypothetical protein
MQSDDGRNKGYRYRQRHCRRTSPAYFVRLLKAGMQNSIDPQKKEEWRQFTIAPIGTGLMNS